MTASVRAVPALTAFVFSTMVPAWAAAQPAAGIENTATPAATGVSSASQPARSELEREREERPAWSHRNQFSLRLAGAVGYRFAIRYATGGQCDESSSQFCHGRSPVVGDVAMGFGVSDAIEIEGRFRSGEPEWNGSIPLAAGLGVRLHGNARSRARFVFGVAAMVDFTHPGRVSAENFPTDVQARLEQGLHYDVGRNFGFYVQIGETIGVLRAFMFTLDVGLGIQARLP